MSHCCSFLKSLAKEMGLLEVSIPTTDDTNAARGGDDAESGRVGDGAADAAAGRSELRQLKSPIDKLLMKRKVDSRSKRATSHRSVSSTVAGGLDVVKHANPHLREIVKVRYASVGLYSGVGQLRRQV